MPKISLLPVAPVDVEAGVLAVFAAKGDDGPLFGADATAAAAVLDVDLAAECKPLGFDGELASVARVPTRGKAKAAILLVVGIGPGGKANLESLRRAAGAAARNANKDSSLAVVVPADLLISDDSTPAQRAQAVTEGAGLGAYAFTAYRSKTTDVPSLTELIVLAGEGLGNGVDAGVTRGDVAVRATALARDLVNTPPLDKRPPALAQRVVEMVEETGVSAKVWDEAALADGGFGGILGVGQGSSAPPRLVELTYEPEGATGHVVLVGKGITFDSGGLSLKPSTAMNTMKSDMSGAAAVAATMTALAELDVRVKVTGLLALAENMPSGEAIRVSDVLTHRGGKTVEVMNTDAEGRLVLGDALAYGVEQQPDALIDLATLTGAQIVALGNLISGLMSNDEGLVAELQAAAAASGEQLWQLPLPEEYADHLRSEVADFRNIGRPLQAGTLIGGLYLQKFVGEIPWAHLDIAGPAFSEDGDSWYTPKGGTGVGVRTLLGLLEARSTAS